MRWEVARRPDSASPRAAPSRATSRPTTAQAATTSASETRASPTASKRIGSCCRTASGRSWPGTSADAVRRKESAGKIGTPIPSLRSSRRRPLPIASSRPCINETRTIPAHDAGSAGFFRESAQISRIRTNSPVRATRHAPHAYRVSRKARLGTLHGAVREPFLRRRPMTDLLSDVQTPSDAELISRVRGGEVAAYGELFTRHKEAAHRLARQLVRGPDSDDLVAEAFAKVLTVLQGGGGPDVAFRAYLLTAVRRLHVDRVRAGQRLHTTDDLTPFDPGVPFQDTAVAGFESGAAAKAFASLPERWQLVLWHLEVEGQKPTDIAPLLGMSANSVSALAYRAREGLRQAFLTMHISDISETDCRWVNEHLGAFVRKGLSKRDATKVQNHLDGCRRCTAMYLELADVNSNLAGIIGPLLLGAAAAGYLASGGAGAAGVLALVSRAKEFVGANAGAATAVGVTVAVVAAAVAVFTIATGGNHPEAKAPDAPVGVTSPAASPGTGVPSEVSPSVSPAPTAAPTIAPTA